MTVCIGVVDKQNKCCYVGADQGLSFDNYHSRTVTPKVFHPCGREDIIIACSGSVRLANLLYTDDSLFDGIPEVEKADDQTIKDLIQTVIPKIEKHLSGIKQEDSDFDLIVAIQNRLYRVQGDLAIYESDSGLEIIGCGRDIAYGAMRTAESYDPGINYLSKIRNAIVVCSEYCYGITATSTVVCTVTQE